MNTKLFAANISDTLRAFELAVLCIGILSFFLPTEFSNDGMVVLRLRDLMRFLADFCTRKMIMILHTIIIANGKSTFTDKSMYNQMLL